MIHKIYSVYDTKAEVYTLPFFQQNENQAKRTFSNWANDPNHTFGKNPEDYYLFSIGSYDDDKATFIDHDKQESLGNALNYIKTGE